MKKKTNIKQEEEKKPITVESRIKELCKKYPNTKKITVSYEGSGDSFSDFWNTEIEYELGNNDINKLEFSDIEDLLWYAIEHSEANFNNEGSQGTVEIDLRGGELKIDNEYVVRETVPSGQLSFKEEEYTKPNY